MRSLRLLVVCCLLISPAASGRPTQHGAVEGADGTVPNCHERAATAADNDDGEIALAINQLQRAAEKRSDPHPRFLMFIGQPRTGHSIVGSILDAHTQMAIANEVSTHEVPPIICISFLP